MVAKDEEGKSIPVPGIIIETKDGIRRFARSIKRQKQSKNRTTQFGRTTFKIEGFLDSLKDQNAKLDLKKILQ